MNLVRTDIVDAVGKRSCVVCELDGTNLVEAAKTFARTWGGGLMARIANGEGPTMTKDELTAISSHAWKSRDGVRFMRRYYDGKKVVYPEGSISYGVPFTDLANRVEQSINHFAHRAWTRGMEHIEEETRKLDAELAVTDAKRYAEGLAEVQQLDAKNQLKAAINAMSDPVAKAAMRAKYPELFDRNELSRMAQERSHAKYGGK